MKSQKEETPEKPDFKSKAKEYSELIKHMSDLQREACELDFEAGCNYVFETFVASKEVDDFQDLKDIGFKISHDVIDGSVYAEIKDGNFRIYIEAEAEDVRTEIIKSLLVLCKH